MDTAELCQLCNHGLAKYASPESEYGNANTSSWGQVVLAISMLFASSVFGICLRRSFPATRVDGINCLCAGMFLALALFHVIPEAAEDSTNWPYFVSIGYLIVLFVDKVVVARGTNEYSAVASNRASARSEPEDNDSRISFRAGGAIVAAPVVERSSVLSAGIHMLPQRAVFTPMPAENASWALVFTLSVHSIFEGLAVGSSDTNMILLAGVISLHKWAAAFALTSFLTVDGVALDNCRLVVLATFVIASPVGAMLGILSNDWEDVAAPVKGAAGGTLLFVAMTEVIPAEFSNFKSNGSARQGFGLLVLGMMVIFTLMTLFPEHAEHVKSPVTDALHTIGDECARRCR